LVVDCDDGVDLFASNHNNQLGIISPGRRIHIRRWKQSIFILEWGGQPRKDSGRV